MSSVARFYAAARKDVFLAKKSCQEIFYLFFNDEGASSYRWTIKNPPSLMTYGFLYFFGLLKTPIWCDGRT
jgi:hypothetical protein